MQTLTLILALIWGLLWAAYLQFTRFGSYLAERRTYITVVVGVGVDLLLARLIMPRRYWWKLVAIISASSIGIIGRSLRNEYAYELAVLMEVLRGVKKE